MRKRSLDGECLLLTCLAVFDFGFAGLDALGPDDEIVLTQLDANKISNRTPAVIAVDQPC